MATGTATANRDAVRAVIQTEDDGFMERIHARTKATGLR